MKAEYMTPAVTVFNEDGTLDEAGNMALYDILLSAGIDGILVAGSAGEFCALSLGQMRALIQFAAGHIAGRAPLLVGTGRMALAETVELSNFALGQGAAGVLVVNPYYFVLPDEDLYNYYSAVAKQVAGDVYIYNFPAGTGKTIPPAVVARLAKNHENIVGLKDSVADFGHTRDVLAAVRPHRPNFKVYSGYDDHFLQNLLSGGNGCIGALSNFIPSECVQWAAAVNKADGEKMKEMQRFVNRLMPLYTLSDPFMPALKHALLLKGMIPGEACLFPLGRIGEEAAGQVRALLAKATCQE